VKPLGITLGEPTVKKEERVTKDGTKYFVYCLCVFVENDGDDAVEGDVTFHGVYPGAPISPVKSVLCTKSNVKIPGVKKGPLGQAKGREEVCCCEGSRALIELVNTQGSVTAAWGKRNNHGIVTVEKADETRQTKGPIKLPD
jgi:hypothetical protein